MASRQESSGHGSRRTAGRNIGPFVIDKEIGKGSFAQVYMGWDKVSLLSLLSTLSLSDH